jgi:hypothetical protein
MPLLVRVLRSHSRKDKAGACLARIFCYPVLAETKVKMRQNASKMPYFKSLQGLAFGKSALWMGARPLNRQGIGHFRPINGNRIGAGH